MKKRIYRAEKVKNINEKKLAEQVKGKGIVFGIDVAKEDFFGVLMDESKNKLITMKWKNPSETRYMLNLLRKLPANKIEVAMEPTGTYGDAVRQLLEEAGFKVYLVCAKRCHDASVVYDGVPSLHDAKAASIIADLHLQGISKQWRSKNEEERKFTARVEIMSMYQDQYLRNLNRIEAKLARYWPELTQILDLDSVTLLVLLENYGSPKEVARKAEEAKALMSKIGRGMGFREKYQMVIDSAEQTIGVCMHEEEREALKTLAMETNRNRKEKLRAKKQVEEMTKSNKVVRDMSIVVGKSTAAVMLVTMGDPRNYLSTGSYVKGIGINLRERSSGKHQGQLKITKRGPGEVRRLLYFAVLRLIQRDVCFQAWYKRKVARDGGRYKLRAVVALMRKLAAALWHVARGKRFDSTRLFDIRRLKLQSAGTC
jgi:transposase